MISAIDQIFDTGFLSGHCGCTGPYRPSDASTSGRKHAGPDFYSAEMIGATSPERAG